MLLVLLPEPDAKHADACGLDPGGSFSSAPQYLASGKLPISPPPPPPTTASPSPSMSSPSIEPESDLSTACGDEPLVHIAPLPAFSDEATARLADMWAGVARSSCRWSFGDLREADFHFFAASRRPDVGPGVRLTQG